MFELEKRIEQWRANLATSGILRHGDINELENHLREAFDDLKGAGLSDDEAFAIASRRLGDTTSLEAEFGKAHPHRLRIHQFYWMVLGLLGYNCLLWWIDSFASWIPAWLGYTAGVRSTWMLAALVATGRMGNLAVVAYLAVSWHAKRKRAPETNAGLSAGKVVVAACALVALHFTYFAGPQLMSEETYIPVFQACCLAYRFTTAIPPFLLVAAWLMLLKRSAPSALSVVKTEEVREQTRTETRLRREIASLVASGLSHDEAIFIASHRDKGTSVLEGGALHQPVTRRTNDHCRWMIAGALGYSFVMWVSALASCVVGWFGSLAGLQGAWLTVAASAVPLGITGLVTVFAIRYREGHLLDKPRRTWRSALAGLLCAVAIVTSHWSINVIRPALWYDMSLETFGRLMHAQNWLATGWTLFLPGFLAVLLIVVSIRHRRVAQD